MHHQCTLLPHRWISFWITPEYKKPVGSRSVSYRNHSIRFNKHMHHVMLIMKLQFILLKEKHITAIQCIKFSRTTSLNGTRYTSRVTVTLKKMDLSTSFLRHGCPYSNLRAGSSGQQLLDGYIHFSGKLKIDSTRALTSLAGVPLL